MTTDHSSGSSPLSGPAVPHSVRPIGGLQELRGLLLDVRSPNHARDAESTPGLPAAIGPEIAALLANAEAMLEPRRSPTLRARIRRLFGGGSRQLQPAAVHAALIALARRLARQQAEAEAVVTDQLRELRERMAAIEADFAALRETGTALAAELTDLQRNGSLDAARLSDLAEAQAGMDSRATAIESEVARQRDRLGALSGQAGSSPRHP